MKKQFMLNGDCKLVEHNKKSVLLKIEELREELSSVIEKNNLNNEMDIEDIFKVINLEEELLKLETVVMSLDIDLSIDTTR